MRPPCRTTRPEEEDDDFPAPRNHRGPRPELGGGRCRWRRIQGVLHTGDRGRSAVGHRVHVGDTLIVREDALTLFRIRRHASARLSSCCNWRPEWVPNRARVISVLSPAEVVTASRTTGDDLIGSPASARVPRRSSSNCATGSGRWPISTLLLNPANRSVRSCGASRSPPIAGSRWSSKDADAAVEKIARWWPAIRRSRWVGDEGSTANAGPA